MLDGREQLYRIQGLLLEILGNISSQLPDALQHKLSNLGFLRIWRCAVTGERLDNLEEQCEQRPENKLSVKSDEDGGQPRRT